MQHRRTIERISEDGGVVMSCEQWECLEGESHGNCPDCGTPTIDGKAECSCGHEDAEIFCETCGLKVNDDCGGCG